jgi:uncharacterized membrane protein
MMETRQETSMSGGVGNDAWHSYLENARVWFFATVLIFILSANWAGLVPGVGSIGWGRQTRRRSSSSSRCCTAPTPT